MPLRFASILLAFAFLTACQTGRLPKGSATVSAAATANPGASPDSETEVYRAHVIGAVEAKWKEYAEKYRAQLPRGTAIADFTLDEFGNVRSVRFAKTPSHPLFRKTCEYSIRNSQFDPPPATLLKDGFHTDAFTFTLH
jgi:outer membrane biosynthesis protein TonB